MIPLSRRKANAAKKLLLLVAFFASSLAANAACGQSDKPFPFVIDRIAPESPANFSSLNTHPAGEDGFCRVVDGHFANDAGRLRVWGVNLCFDANFPPRDAATSLAKKIASLGINGVRIHHHETLPSPRGLYQTDGTMDAQQVDRLDFLLAELHRNGVYANLNLHVGRSVAKSLGLPPLGSGHSAAGDKHAMHFMPQLQNAFWDYCREYLGHVNPYRDCTRANDPAVAMIEILNENRFSRDGPKWLVNAPEPYRSEIVGQWNVWLRKRYASDEELREAWKNPYPIEPETLIDSGKLILQRPVDSSTDESLGQAWALNDHENAYPFTLEQSSEDRCLRVTPQKIATEGWHQQLIAPELSFVSDKPYTIQFEVRSDQEKTINYNTSTMEGGWRQLGLGGSVTAAPEWQTAQKVFYVGEEVDGHGKFVLDLGGTDSPIEFRNIKLLKGAGLIGLPEGQGLGEGNVAVPSPQSVQAARDAFVQFMQDTERAFYQRTTKLVRDELGVKVPLCTTQTNYIGADLADELGDYTDLHSYWNHPLFPGRQWDQSNWTIGHEPLETSPYANQWPLNSPLMRAAWRVHGKPFTYSEWNIGEPSMPSAGAVPIMSFLGSLQDWDAVFFFDFEDNTGQWDGERINGFFRSNGQPCKLALLGPFGQLFRQATIPALTTEHVTAEGAHYQSGVHAFEKLIGLSPTLPRVLGKSPPSHEDLAKRHPPRLVSPGEHVIWDAVEPEKATITINTDTFRSVSGLIGGQEIQLDDWQLTFDEVPMNYGVFVVTSRDGKSLSESSSMQVTIVQHAENSTMHWNEPRTSVGENWGDAPAVAWPIPTTLQIPSSGQKLSVFALDSNGNRVREIKVRDNEDTSTIVFSADDQTLLYELARTP